MDTEGPLYYWAEGPSDKQCSFQVQPPFAAQQQVESGEALREEAFLKLKMGGNEKSKS